MTGTRVRQRSSWGMRASVAVVMALVALVVPVGPWGPFPAAADAALVVTPATGLVDGQEVQVIGSGFSDYVQLAVCPAGIGAEVVSACAAAQEGGYGEPDESGAFSTAMSVAALVSDGSAPVDCRLVACELLAMMWGEADASVIVARTSVAFDPGGPLVPPPSLVVAPATGLTDGQTVQVTGSGYEPDGWVWIEECATEGGDQGCRYVGDGEIDAGGGLDASVRLRASVASAVTTGSRLDCRSATVVCRLHARYGGWRDPEPVTLHFDPLVPLLPPPVLTVAPTTDLVDGQVVAVTGSGFEPGAYVSVRQCAPMLVDGPNRCRWMRFSGLVADDAGALLAEVSVRAVFIPTFGEGEPVDCRVEVCSLLLRGGDDAWSIPLAFDPDAPLLPPPSVTVDPVTGIIDGQVVTVVLTGFDPEAYPRVELCQVETEVCDPAASVSPDIVPGGPTAVELRLYGTFPTYQAPVDCRAAPGCEIRVTDDSIGFAAAVPVSFGPPPPSRGRFIDPVFSEIEVEHDVVYRTTTDWKGRTVELKMDIYQPADDPLAVRPVVMWMHGGWFIFGDKTSMEPYAMASAQRGYVAITLQYRLRSGLSTSDLVGVVEAAHDARADAVAAVDWIQANAAELGIDPRAILVGGYSAGGVLAWNLAYPDAPRGHGPPEVAASAPIAGIPFVGPEPGDPPVIGFHAVDDTVVPYGVARDRCAEALVISVVCEWVEYPDGGHEIVSSQFRDIVDRAHLFFDQQVLYGLGYHDDLPKPPPDLPPVTRPEIETVPVVPSPTSTSPATSTPGGSPSSVPSSVPSSASSTVPGPPAATGSTVPPSPVRPGPARPATAVPGQAGYTG